MDNYSLKCQVCSNRNYTISRAKKSTDKVKIYKKHCKFCRTHQEHKEIKLK